MRSEGSRDPRCGARGVTLFQELKKCETLVLESFESYPRPPYCVLEKQILSVYLADTLNDEIRGIVLDLGASGTKSCTLLW